MLATRLELGLSALTLAFLLILPHKKEIEGRNIYFESTFVTIVIRRRTTMMLARRNDDGRGHGESGAAAEGAAT